MVSQSPARRLPSRDRILAAAAAEFAARGFDGAKVDQIARRARLNKAMVYYHFPSKVAVYRAILRDVFADVGVAVGRVRDAGGAPQAQLRAFVRAVADQAIARPHFPPLWLRELADGGRHLDASVLAEMRRVVETLAAILLDGRRAGQFAPASPLITHAGIVAPLLLVAATRGVRERLQSLLPPGAGDASLDDAVAHVQAATLAALRPVASPVRSPSRVRTRRSS
jgi:TetR/AcrR family transcriptional regulator